jgi:hypothetical protein
VAKTAPRRRRSRGTLSVNTSSPHVGRAARQRNLYAVLVFMVVWIVYAGAWNLDFTNYDDPDYVTANETVLRGLTTDGLTWAIGAGHAANWHPVTWLSHMLDVQIFGVDPAGHHLINVLLHSISSVLLFLILSTATTSPGLSLFVALLFAVHPMQVETVAWISSRKGLLSAALSLGALLLYVQTSRVPSRARWAGVHILFALSLMAKPMLVTWPFVLLLFDRWPLQRPERWSRLE